MFWRFRDYVGDESPQKLRQRYGRDLISTGLWSQVFGSASAMLVRDPGQYAFWVSLVMAVLGSVLLVVGCRRHAAAKGYRRWLGLLGLFSLPGTFLLMLIPDRAGRDGRRRGFEVLRPQRVSTTWVLADDDPRFRPRPWAQADQMADLWQRTRIGR